MDNDFFDENINLISYLPPAIIAIVISIFNNPLYLLTYVPILFLWMAIICLILIINAKCQPIFNKHTEIEIINDLNISKKLWNKSSNEEKWHLYYCLQEQNKIKRLFVNDNLYKISSKINKVEDLIHFNKMKDTYEATFQKEINDKWKDLTLEQRIEMINNHIELSEKKRIKKEEKEKLEKEKLEKERAIKEAKEKEIKIEEEKKKIEEDRIKLEEKLNLERIEKENQIKNEQIKKEQYLIKKKEQNDIEYKNRIKQNILENERKKILASEAIEELIESGKLGHNFSQQSNNREPIPSYIKEAVWKRDKEQCVNCGSRENLEFDHNIPVSKGGSNSINNIQLLCLKCNRTKSNKIM